MDESWEFKWFWIRRASSEQERGWQGLVLGDFPSPNLEVGDNIFSSTKNNCFWRSILWEEASLEQGSNTAGDFSFLFPSSVSMAATSRLNRILLFSSSFFTLCRFLNSCSVFRRCAFTNWSSGLHMTCMTCHDTLSAGPPQPEMIGRTLITSGSDVGTLWGNLCVLVSR